MPVWNSTPAYPPPLVLLLSAFALAVLVIAALGLRDAVVTLFHRLFDRTRAALDDEPDAAHRHKA